VKHILYDCDNCFHASAPQNQTGAAISKAIEEGFVFVGRGKNYKQYCKECASNKATPPDPQKPPASSGSQHVRANLKEITMSLYYAETGMGCCIREATSFKNAANIILREVGTYNGIRKIRKASKADIGWVKGMGGYVPEIRQILGV